MKNKTAKNQKTNSSSLSQIDETATIQEGAFLIGDCKVGANSFIGAGSVVENSVIGDGVVIKCSYIENSTIKNNVSIGPFAHIRPNSVICDGVKIGNFVEIKNSVVEERSKVSHLAYVGDAEIGKRCNIGCGAIFVNYNGKQKQKTIVEDDCFIGSNCNIVAPVRLASKTYVCAGSTLTKNTKPNDFVIARSRETIKNNYAQKYLEGGE